MPHTPDLHTIRITCTPDQVESVEALFSEEAFGNALSISTFSPPREKLAKVGIIVDGMPNMPALKTRLTNFPTFEVEPIGNLDWIKKVSGDFPPIPIARWTVFGAAHRDKITDQMNALQIDATSAFGTGEHPTTRGCLVILDEMLTREGDNANDWSMLDLGCGSGILAMAFAKALSGTNAKAFGVDMDEQSVEIADENVKINGVSKSADFAISMGYDLPEIQKRAPYDLIMANIFADPLCELAPQLKQHLKTGGKVILSGILNTQAKAVIDAHTTQGLKLIQKIEDGEWSILELSL